MMINNNPYNLPERPQNKTSRIYIQSNLSQFRTTQPPQRFPPNPQVIQRISHHGNSIQKKQLSSLQQLNSPYKQTYPQIRPQVQHYITYPKIQPPNSNHINNYNPNFVNNNNINNNIQNNIQNNHISSSLQKKQLNTNNSSIRQSYGPNLPTINTLANSLNPTTLPPSLEIVQINDRIQTLSQTIKSYQKRLQSLQKSASTPITPSSSSSYQKIPIQLPDTPPLTNSINNQQIKLLFQQKFLEESQIQFNKIKSEINNEIQKKNQEILCNYQSKVQQIIQHFKKEQSYIQQYKNSSQQFTKQIQTVKNQILQIQQLLHTKFQLFHSTINRIQKQSQPLPQPQPSQPTYKPSPIKCSSPPIPLRYIQCFKIKKSPSHQKPGQIKITLTDNTYYIDSQGYLLDQDHFYLMDANSNKIQLQQKHLKLLKQQSILI